MSAARPHLTARRGVVTLLVLLATLLVPPAASAAVAVDELEWAQVKLINQYRARNGAPRLVVETTLTRTAQWMGRSMADNSYFSHTDHLGRDPFARLAAFGYPSNSWRGENLAAGNSDAASTFTQWRESPGHNQNMLNRNYRAVGIARVVDADSQYGYYWVTEFGSAVTKRVPSVAETSRLARYSPAQRRKIKRTARSCSRIRKGSRAWKRKKCVWNIRTARRLRAVGL